MIPGAWTSPPPATTRRASQRGFSLLEVLVALAVLAIALLSLTALRTASLSTAGEARNLRFARALAYQVLSEARAGLLKAYDLRGQELTKEEFPGFRYKVLIGETEIQEEESLLAETKAMSSDATDRDQHAWERQQWLNERSRLARARAQGVVEDDLQRDELEVDDTPDEETFEEVAIYVYYPSFRPSDTDDDNVGVYRLRSRMSTLALSGLTSEQAQDRQSNLSSSASESGGSSGQDQR